MLEYALMFGFGFLLGVRYGDDPVAIVLLMIAFVPAVLFGMAVVFFAYGVSRFKLTD